MLLAREVAASGLATVGSERVAACLALSEAAPTVTCVVAADIVAGRGMLRLRDACIVRFLYRGWATAHHDAIDIVRDGELAGLRVADGRWVPRHSRLPYRLVALSDAEHATLRQHLAEGRAWEAFKTVQLLYLPEPGFGGSRDTLAAPPGYAADALPGRDYLVVPVRA